MKRKSIFVVVVLVGCVAVVGTAAAQASRPNAPEVAVGTAFTYQGRIKRNGTLFTVTCDLQFNLWDDAAAGIQQGATLNVNAVNVDNGIFAVELDFGNQAHAQPNATYELVKSSIGPGMSGSVGVYNLAGSIGQPVAVKRVPASTYLAMGSGVAGSWSPP